MIQIIDNFEHRSKLPNFARDQFDTLEEMKNVRDEDIDEGHISYCISTDKHYKFNASNAIDQSTGKWREFKGEKGDPGKDGQDGTNVSSNLTAFVFKSSETTPSKPVGGSWNSDTNVFTPPTGWYTTDQNMVGTIWMSWAVFQTTGTIQGEWSTPVRITGENGKDGQDGKSIEFIYKVSNRVPNSSDKPSSVNEDGSVPDGWTGHPTGVSESNQYEWMCVRTKTDDLWSDWNGPTVWSKWGANGKDGPQGVPGPAGQDGKTLYTWIRYAEDANGTGISNSPDGKSYIGLAYNKETASESNNPSDYTWSKITGKDGVAGPAGEDGKTLYTWIKYADTMPSSSSSTIYDIPNENTKYIGIAVNKDTASESTDAMVYTWSLFRGADGTNGTDGKDGRDGRIVYPAGIYDATVTYTATDTKAPYVLYGETYYVMNVTTSWTGSQNEGKTPADDYGQYGEHATWIPMEKFETIYTKLLIANNGTIGSFVFNGDYMFSQQGVDYLYNEVDNYEDFGNDSIPFKFTDTSMWIKSSVSYVSFTDNTINITQGSNSTLTLLSDKLTSGQSIPEFYVQVSGVAEGSTSAYLIWKYYTEDGGTSNYDYIQTSGIIKLHGSVYNSLGSASLSLYTNSTSLDNEITVTLLPTTFIPNLQINGRTGDVVINRGTFKGSMASNWYKVELSGSDTNTLAIGEGDTYITITGNGTSPNTMRIQLPSYTYSSSLVGKVLTTFHVINLSGSVLDFNNIVGRIFPAYTFPGGNEYSNVFVKQYGKLDVAIVIGGFPVLYYFYVLNPWDFELSDAYTSGTQNPVSKTFG